MEARLFDLNIEEVLENWEVHHAIREIIANALDEQLISQTEEIKIFKTRDGNWVIRDFGRGLKIEHFTLNENEEKLSYPAGIIGKFGVGLKDALATFHRRGVGVRIFSPSGIFRLRRAQKHSFGDITTLHVEYDQKTVNIRGTAVELIGVTDDDILLAKSLFLKFSDANVLETNRYGQIIERESEIARVYINGVLASEEPNFLFSYNITSLTEAMKKRLNRERLNVGRTTYTDRVKSILKNAESSEVLDLLADEATKRASGEQKDELLWIEISQLAYNLLYERKPVAYVTESELQERPDILDNIRSDGHQVVLVSDREKAKLHQQMTSGGPEVRILEAYVQEYNESFQYKFVDRSKLTPVEKQVFDLTPKLLSLVGIRPAQLPPVFVSDTIRITNDNTGGVWDQQQGAIIIRRSILNSAEHYAGTLLHEAAHAMTGTVDATREFESVLSRYLGKAAVAALGLRR